MLDLSLVFDPFTLAFLVGGLAWLDRRLRAVESKVAYERGFESGQASLRTHDEDNRTIEE
jgi:hypothetical protein